MTGEGRPWLRTYAELGLDWARVPPLPDESLAAIVARHAAVRGEREALVHLDDVLDYRTLDRLAGNLAGALTARGLRRGDVLAVHLPSTAAFLVACVAASKLGAIVSSVSALLTPPEVRHQLNDAGASVLLTLDALLDRVIAPIVDEVPALARIVVTDGRPLAPSGSTSSAIGSARSIPVEPLGVLLESGPTTGACVKVAPDDVILLQYTGGTTGRSKGAELTLANVLGNHLQADCFYDLREGAETFASAYPLFHVGGIAVAFNALRVGGTLLLVPDPRDTPAFCEAMRRRPPTVLAAVPALYQMLLARPEFHALDFAALRLALSGAAPFSAEEKQRLEAVIGAGKIAEVYGMTETGPVQTCNPAQRFKLGSVGIPLPGTDVRILDVETGTRELPVGEVGEIVVAGPQVMRGYRTAPGEGMRVRDGRSYMHTGDVGTMDDEGYVHLCDRSKDMLIVGGYKVFSVEVESALMGLPWIALSALVGRPDESRPGNDVARLYVQKRPGTEPDDEVLRAELIAFCRERLAPYKVPREVVFVDAVPLTSVGKIDKKALRATAFSGAFPAR